MAQSLEQIIRNREELENSAFGRTYLALQTDEERLAFFEEATVSHISTDEREKLFRCMKDFVNPLTKDNQPDHEMFEKRLNAILERRFEMRLKAGQEIEEIMQSDLFDNTAENFKEKCIVEGVEAGDAAIRFSEMGAMLNNDEMCRDFFETYCEKYGQSVNEKNLNDKMFQTIALVGAQYEAKRLEESSPKDRERHALMDETGSIIPAKDKVELTQDDQDRIENKLEQVKKNNDNRYQDRIASAEAKSALDKFNTKRSKIFLGRESKEHKELREAAETYQEKLKAFQDSRESDPDKKLLAMQELEKAAETMQDKVDKYQKEKRKSPNTPAGQDRLEGAIKLGEIAANMKEQMRKEREAMQANGPEIGIGRQSEASENEIVRKKTNVSELMNLENIGKEKETHQRVSIPTEPVNTTQKHK